MGNVKEKGFPINTSSIIRSIIVNGVNVCNYYFQHIIPFEGYSCLIIIHLFPSLQLELLQVCVVCQLLQDLVLQGHGVSAPPLQTV